MKAEVAMLKMELEQLKKLVFGSKSERFVPEHPPEQLRLFGSEQEPEPSPEEPPKPTEKASRKRDKKKHPGRHPLPDNIPVEEIFIEPEQDTSDMVLIGQEITETVDYRPGILVKRRYIRNKYARRESPEGDGQQDSPAVVIGPMPCRPIPKATAEAGLLAFLIVSKYIDHLPFYRQIERFKRDFGWAIRKSTLNGWFAACCTLLEPLGERLKAQVLSTDYLQADETTLDVLSSNTKGKSHKGYLWAYRNPQSGDVFFDYRRGRGAYAPKEVLLGFTGSLQCDGYAAYKTLSSSRQGSEVPIGLVGCLAHIRRKFFEAKEEDPEATHALELIRRLYAIEKLCREQGYDYDRRLDERKRQAAPIFAELRRWVDEQLPRQLPKSQLGKAMAYAKDQLAKLSAYLKDGRIEIDNNGIENAIRPLALGRKNYLFAGSDQAAKRAATVYSFFASCKAAQVNPLEWLTDVLKRIPEHPVNKLDQLLPTNWAEHKHDCS